MPANDQLTALDGTFLELEEADDSAVMHIGGALLFAALPGGGTPAIGKVREHLERRLDLLPRYRQKLGAPHTGGLSWPLWEADQRFEIEAHVRHATLPSPGEEGEFLEWISDFYSHRLDRSRPLWEIVLLDGLADGRWALVTKTHHCLVDGVGSVDLVGLLLDAEPAPHDASAPRPARASASVDASHGWLSYLSAPIGLLTGAGLAAARAGAHAVVHPREGMERSRDMIDLLVVNDVVLCAATGALRELLLARGEDPPRHGLRAMVPVNVRSEGDHGDLGNQVSSLFVGLPVAEDDPLRRYQLVVAATAKLKAGGQALAASALTGLTELAPPVLHAGLARMLFSGGMTFGLCADRGTVPDLDVLTDGIVTSLDELAALAHATSAAR